MNENFNQQVFVVKDIREEEAHLLISETTLDKFETFGCLGNLNLCDEAVGSRWGYDAEDNNVTSTALRSVGLNPYNYKRRGLDDPDFSQDCLDHVRTLLGVNEGASSNSRYQFS